MIKNGWNLAESNGNCWHALGSIDNEIILFEYLISFYTISLSIASRNMKRPQSDSSQWDESNKL